MAVLAGAGGPHFHGEEPLSAMRAARVRLISAARPQAQTLTDGRAIAMAASHASCR